MGKPPSRDSAGASAQTGDVHARARQALRDGTFDLAEKLLAREDVELAELVENLRIYQAELEIQNSELREAQSHTQQLLERQAALFAAIPLAALVVDHNGLVLEANQVASTLFGLDHRHLHRHYLRRLVDPSCEGAFATALFAARREGVGKADPLIFLKADHQPFPGALHLACLPPLSPGGEAAQFVCAVVDLSERVRQEEALRDSQVTYRVLAECSPDWDYWLGADGRYRYVSPACQPICGHPPDDFFAVPDLMSRLVHPDDRAQWQTHWQSSLSTHTSGERPHEDLQLRILRADGEIRWIEHHCQAAFDQHGTYLGQRGVNRDITARKLAETQLARVTRLYETLSQSNQAIVRVQDRDTLLRAVVRIAVEYGGLKACAIHFFDSGQDEPRLAASHGVCPPCAAGVQLLDADQTSAFPIAIVARRGQPHACAPCPFAHDRSDRAEQAPSHAATCCAAHPLRLDDAVIGAMTFYADDIGFFTPEVNKLLDEIAMDLSYALARFAEAERRERIAAQLRVSQERNRLIVETASEGVCMLDAECRLSFANSAVTRLLGYPLEALLGRNIADFMFAEDLDDHAKRMRNRQQGRTEVYERRFRRADGGAVFCLVSSSPVTDDVGKFAGSIKMLTDISEIKRSQQMLAEHERQLGSILDAAPIGIGLVQKQRLREVNAAMTTITGYARAELIDQPARMLYPDDAEHDHVGRETDAQIRSRGRGGVETRWRRKDGVLIHVVLSSAPLDRDDPDRGISFTAQDITARKAAEEQLRQTARAFESSAEGIVITDANGNIVSVNRAFTEITGYTQGEVLGQNPRLLKSGRHDPSFYQAMWEHLLTHGRWQGEIWNRRKDGEIYPQWTTISCVDDEHGRISHFVSVFGDISELKASQAKLDFLAYHDPLTRLPNRLLLKDRLSHALNRARRNQGRLALLFIDLDRFKNINDSFGHAVGDDLLCVVAQRMSEQVRGSDTLARLGGDEFVVLLEDEDSARRTATVANKLVELFAQPFALRDNALYVTASIGISVFPADGEDVETLMKHADLAMYQAKEQGRNTFQFYQAEMSSHALERLTLENALRGALARGEFRLHYQPQINLNSGHLEGVEALLRWQHPELGMVPPSRFVPIAEDMGIIAEIGAWVLREACAQLARWQNEGILVPHVAVNLSVQQLERESVTDLVAETLALSGLAPQRLELEITESMIMRQAERAISILASLRGLGVAIAVDDFGTGYSSLGYLKRLPLDRLKVDYTFVRDIGRDDEDESIVRAIISLGRSLGLEVVAEGIERAEQADFLREEGCRIGQGYFYSRPVSAADIGLQPWRAAFG